MIFHIRLGHGPKKLSAFCPKIISGVVKNAIHVSIGTFWWQRQIFKIKYDFITTFTGIQRINFGFLLKKLWWVNQRCKLRVNSNISEKLNFSEDNIFFHSRTLNEEILVFCWKFFGRVWQLPRVLSMGTFWPKFFLRKNNFVQPCCSIARSGFGQLLKKF